MEQKPQTTDKPQHDAKVHVSGTCFYCGEALTENEHGICRYCDEEEDDGKDEDFYTEQRERELEERAANCTCGAWQMTSKGEVIHVADCCCGAE